MILSLSVVLISVFLVFFFGKYPLSNKIIRGYNGTTLYKSEEILANNIFQYLIPVICLAVLFGFRYDVGTDYLNYKEIYESSFSGTLQYSVKSSGVEYAYAIISHVLYHLGMPYYIMFFVMAAIPMCFYLAAFKDKPFLIGYATFFLAATGVLFWYFNIQRQGIAFFILLFSVKYIIEKKFWKYVLLVALASGFHISSVLFVFCYIFVYFKRSLLFHPIVLSVIYLLFWILSPYLIKSAIFIISFFLTGKYAYYINSIETWKMETGSGLGLIAMHIIDLCIIFMSSRLCDYYRRYRYDIYFRIFYVGVLFANIAGTNMVLSRIPFCFTSFRFILLAFLTYYFVKTWKNRSALQILTMCLIWGLSILMLGANAFNSPYQFIPSL